MAILLQNNVRFSERIRDCVPALGEYGRAWDAQVDKIYASLPPITGGRGLIVALAPNAQRRIWMCDLEAGDVSLEEEALFAQADAGLPPPHGVRAPIIFVFTYWLNTPERQLLPNEIKVPSGLLKLADVRIDGRQRTYDEILELIWPEQE